MIKLTLQALADAIVAANPNAGKRHGALNTPEKRAERLLVKNGDYHAYLAEGDPSGWASCDPSAIVATIYMEEIGGDAGQAPFNYWDGGLGHSLDAMRLLPASIVIEFVNPAVALVYREA